MGQKTFILAMLPWAAALLAGFFIFPAMAAGVEQIERPGSTRPELPAFRDPAEAALSLPQTAVPGEPGRLSEGIRVQVRQIRFEGHSASFEPQLRQLAEPYENRTLSSAELEELRHRISLFYLAAGYINSGAVLPDQEVRDGVVTFRILEGRLTGIHISGNERLKDAYLRERIELGAGTPLNANSLQQRLQLLLQGGLVEQINAELLPGPRLGDGALNVAVKEARPYAFTAAFSNYRSPSVGGYYTELFATHRNLTGRGDTLEAKYGFSTGLDDYMAGYTLPLNASDTSVFLRYGKTPSLVVEAPFTHLDIRSETETTTLGLTHPLWQTPAQSMVLGLSYDDRRSDTSLLGVPFSFSAGIPEGHSVEHVWRFSQDWLTRTPDRVMAFRSTFSLASTNALPRQDGYGPDDHYFAWLGQFQWARRFADRGQVIFRFDTQWTRQSLLPVSKFGLGGANSVRGYRENQLLRDKGFVTSAEYRRPLFAEAERENSWQWAVFSDYGRGWNAGREEAYPVDIGSAGLGLLWNPRPDLHGQLYLARALRTVQNPGHDLQDDGVHFRFSYQF
ncbi:MAG: BamA/TamA family outer membrane protein [Sulfuricella denitrificans]|nr:BamA/TamA family outer membrane protein [Sulfuricella denitrificans]